MEYGDAMKKRVLDLYDQGCQTKEVAERLRVSKSWCRRVKQRRGTPPRRMGGSEPTLDQAAQARLATWIGEQPDSTLEELRAKILRELNIAISIGALWNTIRRMKFSFKKSL